MAEVDPRGWGLGGTALAFVAGGLLPAITTWAGLTGRVTWESWVHESAGHFDWTPFIHPPLYNEFLWLGERMGAMTGQRPAVLLALLNVLLAGAVAAAVGRVTARRCGPRFATLAVALVALSACTMRPFEQYPVSRLLVVLAVLGCLELARDGAGRRWLATGTFVCGFVAVEIHLNAWLVLGPLMAVLAWSNPTRRRPLLLLLGGLVLAFAATALRGLPQVLADGPMTDASWSAPLSWAATTTEWSNVLLLVPLAVWAVPSVRRRCSPRVGAALTAALLLHLLVVLGQMYAGLAIGGTRYSGHHYFELVDALMVLAAVWALSDVAERRGGRWIVVGGSVALFAVQLWLIRMSWWALSTRAGSGDSWL